MHTAANVAHIVTS